MNPSRTTVVVRALMAAFGLLVGAQMVLAGGFAIYEQGAAASAQGGAFVARASDASAGFYNPAGLAMVGKPGQWRIYAGLTPVTSIGKFQGLNPSPGISARDEAKDKTFFPFNLHVAYQIDEKCAAALAVTTPFGLGTEWKNPNNTYSGRYRSILGNIQVVDVSPTFSYKFTDNFALGVGVDYVYSKVELKRNNSALFFNGQTTQVYDVAQVQLKGTDNGSFGFSVGAMYKANEQWSFGVDYKHKVKNTYKGTAKFTQITHAGGFGPVVDANVAALLNNPAFGGTSQDGNTSIEFPNSLALGVAYKPMEKLALELDYVWVGWKTFDQVQIELPDNQITSSPPLQENYKNTWQIRFGVEYWAMENLALRAGYIYDKTPCPTSTVNPLLPDADRNDFGFGIGYKFNDAFHVDLSYLGVFFKERSTKGQNVDGYDGIYNTHVNLFAIGLGYSFGGQ